MNIISYYDAIPQRPLARLDVRQEVKQDNTVTSKPPIVSDAKIVTLAEFDPVSKDAITAHRLKDYRRKTFNLTLLPDIHLLLDDIMEGSTYWNAKLHNESPYV